MATTTATRPTAKRPAAKRATAQEQRDRSHAESLFADLRDMFSNAERIIIEIIQTEAWAALGYDSFAEAWADRMAGVRLATDAMRAHVIYALLDTLSVDDTEELTGASAITITKLKRLKLNGVPAGMARVREHSRKLPGGKRGIHVFVSAETFSDWRDVAEAAGTTLADMAEAVLRAHFESLAE